MNDVKIIVKILSAILISEEKGNFDSSLVSPEVLGTTQQKIDIIGTQLQKSGYIEGLQILEVDGMPYPHVYWSCSAPMLTIEGRMFIEQNEPLKKAINELKEITINCATQALANTIMKL